MTTPPLSAMLGAMPDATRVAMPAGEPEAQRLARIRRNLALLKQQNAPQEDVDEYLASERVSVAPERNAAERALPALETFLSGVPAANRLVAAGRAAGSPSTTREELDAQRENVNQFRSEHPVAGLGLQLAGGLATPLGPLKAAGTAGRVAKGATTLGNAAIGGALAGASEADLQGGSVAGGGALGGVLGAGVVGGMRGVPAAARAISRVPQGVRSMFSEETAKKVATRDLEQLVDKAGGPAAVAKLIAERRAAGGDPMLFEAVGEAGERATRASRNAPFSSAGADIRDALGARAGRAAGRADEAVLEGAGIPKQEPGRVVDEMTARRREAAAPLYEKAREAAQGARQIDETTGLPLNPDGTVTLYHHTSADAARSIRQSGKLVSRGEPDVYLTTEATPTTGYGDTVVPIRVRPSALAIDDEFPSGRRDFRLASPRRSTPVTVEPEGQGGATSFIRNQIEKNSLLKRLVSESREVPELVDAPLDSFEVLDDAYKSLNARIQGARQSGDLDLARRLDGLRKPMLEALEEMAPGYREAATTFAEESVPLNSFAAGQEFEKLTPYDIDKALATGRMANGYSVDPASFRAGVAQRLRDLIGRKASSPSLEGVASSKNPVAGLNSAQLDARLRSALGSGYDKMLPTFREILREYGGAQRVLGGSNTAAQLADDPNPIAAALNAAQSALGFGHQAALRRFLGGGLREMAATRAGKLATERGRGLVRSGTELDDFLASLLERSPVVRGGAPARPINPMESTLARLLASLPQR